MRARSASVLIAAIWLCACRQNEAINAGNGCEGYRIAGDVVLLFDDTLHGADADQFRCITNEYATDGEHVFFSAKCMPGIDASSFQVLSHGYSKDRRTVYFDHYSGDPIAGAEPGSFEVIDLSFSKDRDHVYYWDVSAAEVEVLSADPLTFHKFGACYMDEHHLFNSSGEVELALDTTSIDLVEALCSEEVN